MQAAIMDAPGTVRIAAWPTPTPGPGEVAVSVCAVGVCAGDLYIYKGVNPYASYPIIAGHEIAGRIAAFGAGVAGLEIGAAVVVEPFIGCGQCYPCRVGKSNCCANLEIIGVHRPGGFAEVVVAPATHVHRVPDGLSLSTASFAEPIAIGVQACRRGAVTAADHVLILGCGPIGLALIEVAHARGAHVLATDISEERMAFAATLGADVLPSGPTLLPTILERTHGEGMPVVIEATGNINAMESAPDLVASGGRVVIVGLGKRTERLSLPALDLTRKEMTIVGSRASANCFPEALSLLASGAISYPRVATEISLWDAPQVFTTLGANPGALHKAIFVVPEV